MSLIQDFGIFGGFFWVVFLSKKILPALVFFNQWPGVSILKGTCSVLWWKALTVCIQVTCKEVSAQNVTDLKHFHNLNGNILQALIGLLPVLSGWSGDLEKALSTSNSKMIFVYLQNVNWLLMTQQSTSDGFGSGFFCKINFYLLLSYC